MAMAERHPLLQDFQKDPMTASVDQTQLKAFQGTIGYQFRNIALLIEALTHSSAVQSGGRHNERLEWKSVV